MENGSPSAAFYSKAEVLIEKVERALKEYGY